MIIGFPASHEVLFHREAPEHLAPLSSLLCNALDVSWSGFHAWINRKPANGTLENEVIARIVRQSFVTSDRTYGARRVWHDVLADGFNCGLHRI